MTRMRTATPRVRAAGAAAALFISTLGAALGAASAGAQSVELRRAFADEPLTRPVHLAPVPDGTGRLVVVEQAGVVKWFDPDAGARGGVVADLRENVSSRGNEEGLLSIAFHPRFTANRRVYVYHSAAAPRRSVVVRFEIAPGALRIDPESAHEVMSIVQPYGNHNGGQLAFGPDGYLYVGLGDGGSGGDPQGHGQDRTTLLGSILRIDVDRETGGIGYAIPPDNPFAGATDGSRPEIWAYGLRNPWRFAFDRETGALFAADVGQNAYEEVDRIVRGGNYGWNRMEGTHCFSPRRGCDRAGLELPVTEYGRGMGVSISGGFVYRGAAVPGLAGRYLFGDYGSGTIWSIPADALATVPPVPLIESGLAVSAIAEGPEGEAWVLDLRGGVYRMTSK